jgi:2-succinyl-5-enolpyruvyl-6-hydroxy-3-cyclohexene-1-carboxylate synthase
MLAGLCAAYGLRKTVLSPGSRNAPLIMAFHNHSEIECFVIPDERSAAYFAIGIAQFTGQPVGLICTSGTAALNYTPAMAEAYYQQLPLVAITADRPPEWVDQLDGQTINQTGIYGNFIVYQAQLPVEAYSGQEAWHVERLVRDGFRQLALKNRPIHFNVPLREPLYHTTEQNRPQVKPAVSENYRHVFYDSQPMLDELKRYSRILLVFGMRRPNSAFSVLVDQLASRKDIVILGENLSNIPSECVFQMSDALFSAIQGNAPNALKPELFISFGDMVLSKPMKQWIRSLENTDRWIVTQSDLVPDVFQGIDRIIHQEPESFIKSLLAMPESGRSNYYEAWQKAYETISGLQTDYVNAISWSDMQVFRILSKNLPDNSIVHLGNSSPVRYAQFFQWKKGTQFFGNRGTSGIDGVTSTAIGMASQTDKLVTLITGDVSFLYDSNALWNNYKKKNFKMIVINNQGGNIFSLIGGPENTGLMNDYFVTHIPVALDHLCKAYGISYYVARNKQELESGLEQCYADPACALLEVQTEPAVNTGVWKEYFRTIKNNFQYE